MTWQPIETAPKDGTWVIVWGGKTDESTYLERVILSNGETNEPAYLNKVDGDDRPVVAKFTNNHWDGFRATGYWSYSYRDGAWRFNYANPTHWMPLPELPTGEMK